MKILLLTLLCLSIHCTPVSGAETRELSVREFVALEKEWDALVGKPLRIEGRYSSFSRSAMRFQKCDLTFFLPPNSVRPVGRSKTLEVNGTLKREKKDLVFQVTAFRLIQSDQDVLLRKKQLLPKDQAALWYQLGKNSIERGKFYNDPLLQQLGTEILLDALEIEKKQKKNSPAILLELAAKAANLGLDNRVRLMLLFESCQLQFQTALKNPDYNFSELRTLMEKQLPGTLIPLTSLKGVLFDRFRKSPLKTYQQATDHARRQISRLFYLQILKEKFQRALKEDGSNGDSIAAAYLKIAPDDPATAEFFREQALLFHSKNITRALRNEVLAVASKYREQNRKQMAETVLKTWLSHRASQLSKAGPSDYVATALDYEQWFSDSSRAQEILLMGIQRFPEDKALTAELTRRDYVKKNNQWISRNSLPATRMNKIDQAIQGGRIVEGMTRKQVADSLGGPKTFSRIASEKQTVLIWNYPDAHLAVRFTQRTKTSDYVVVAVSPLSTR